MFTRRYDDRHRFLLTNATGAIDDQQLLDHSLAMGQECSRRCALLELALLEPALDVSGLTPEGLRSVAALEATRAHVLGGRLAIVSSAPLLIGMARIFTAHTTFRPTAVLASVDEGLAALGLTAVAHELQPLIDAALEEWHESGG
jgi:hypothetical protein